MLRTGSIFAALGLSALVGGMLFFGAIVAPLVFTKLPPDTAGTFIRAIFPRYYAFIVVSSGIAAAGFLLRGQTVSGLVLLAVLVVTCWLWFWLIPHLNALRDAGNTSGFDRGHRLSVWINFAELVAALWLLVRSALLP
jgi:hypothetical protein